MSKVQVTNNVLEKQVPYQGKIILRYTINYPSFSTNNEKYSVFLAQINEKYHKKALLLCAYCEEQLTKTAINQSFITSAAVELMLSYTITYNQDGILSLYFDQYEFAGGAHGTTIRSADNWDLNNQSVIKLNEIANDYHLLLKEVEKQINDDPNKYYSNANELVLKTFNPNNFYLTPRNLVIFFQEYEIAPYASGIVQFLIPYTFFCSEFSDASSLFRFWHDIFIPNVTK